MGNASSKFSEEEGAKREILRKGMKKRYSMLLLFAESANYSLIDFHFYCVRAEISGSAMVKFKLKIIQTQNFLNKNLTFIK